MAEHFCEYDHNLDEPCGKPAGIKWQGMWLCAEHYDWTMDFFEKFGGDPFATPGPKPDDLADLGDEEWNESAIEHATSEEIQEL